MKSLIFFMVTCVILYVQAITEEQKALIKKQRGECYSKSGVDPEAIRKFRAGDLTVENDSLKRFALCMMIKSELMTKEGVFQKDLALSRIPVEADRLLAEKIIDGCLAKKGSTPEEAAWNYIVCHQELNPKHPLL